jgi:SpoVK/Ycf46/Vps4 family AAA+-type ATPase
MIDDFQRFLKSQSHYEALGVAWRRGAILVGPPGNGKTHFLRALVHELEVPCLYVQSIAHPYYEAEQLLQRIFQRARELRPCILIFEDLDSLINHENRSFFLNQLDGFERNHGLMVIATTNHPENIDSAILDRPSRFDRKYNFPLPELEQRVRFLEIWKDKLQGSGAVGGSWDNSSIMVVAQQTEGFSFAYMKELMVSSLLQWIDQEQAVELGGLLIKQQVEGRLDFPQILAQQATQLQQQRRCTGA